MYFQSKIMTSLAGAAVALVILVDLATGQGPPIYTNYLQSQQQNYRGPPQPLSPSAGLYPQRIEYSSKQAEKELEKAVELGKVEDQFKDKSLAQEKMHEKKLKTLDKKEFEKLVKSEEKDLGKKEEDYESSTQAPGMLSSLSNSMSGAWNRLSSLGRSTRSVDEPKDGKPAANNETISESANTGSTVTVGSGGSSSSSKPAASSGRGIDSYEYLQQRQNGYIYFKVPKHLVCNY